MAATSTNSERVAQLIAENPDLAPYAIPVSAGDIAELGEKLDEIVVLLRLLVGRTGEVAALKSAMDRLLSRPA